MTTKPIAVSLRAKLVVAVLAIGVAAVLCELAARAVFPRPPALGREPQVRFQSDPELGFVHVPDQAGYLDDGLATINRLGLRGRLPADPKPAGSRRVVAIGDSTTFGWGVGDADTYLVQLEERLAATGSTGRVEVINAGVSAYDLKQAAGLLERMAPVLRPDVVLVGVFWNDLPYRQRSPDGEVLVADAGMPASEAPPAADAPRTARHTFQMANQPTGLTWLLRQSRLAFAIRHAWLKTLAPTGAATNQVRWEMALLDGRRSNAIDSAWRDIEATLTRLRTTARTAGCAVGVVIMPIRAQVDGDYPNAAYQTRVRAMAETLGMFVVDPLPKFRAVSDRSSLFIPYDRMHFTGPGNALIAEAAFEALLGLPQFVRVPTSSEERRREEVR